MNANKKGKTMPKAVTKAPIAEELVNRAEAHERGRERFLASEKTAANTKKQVPDWIEDFWKLSEVEQISEIDDCVFDNESLLELLEHSQYATVQTAIHSELNARGVEIPKRAVAVVEKSKSEPPETQNATAVAISLNFQSIAAHMDYRYTIIKNPSRAASRAVVEIGFLIMLVKRELPHGSLNKWLQENTKINDSWAAYCRRAAEKFCETHGEQALLTLCNPSADNPPEAVEQAEQLMMDFTKGVGPTALLHNLGIKKRPAAEKSEPVDPAKLSEIIAVAKWESILNSFADAGRTWAELPEEALLTVCKQMLPVVKDMAKTLKEKGYAI
jgi:hypothetical protein